MYACCRVSHTLFTFSARACKVPRATVGRARNEFPAGIKRVLANRVGTRCSNSDCQRTTSGPNSDPEKAVNIGVAAHITAAAAGGPRYDAGLSPEERRSAENGIWLCQTCAKLIDNDPERYHSELLWEWKRGAEERALATSRHTVLVKTLVN